MAEQGEVKVKIVKKKGGHAAAHGGAWKVAYADLVTALMAFFLLMWLLGSANANTKAGIAGMFQDPDFFKTDRGKAILAAHGQGILPGGRGMQLNKPDGTTAPEPPPDDPVSQAREQEKKEMQTVKEAIEQAFQNDQLLESFKENVKIDFTEEGLRIQVQDVGGQVLFDSGSAQPKPHTMSILKEISTEVGKRNNRIVIGGHTDSKQYAGKAYTNWELSADRANSARRIMEASGLRPGQVMRVTGYADSIPMEGKSGEDPLNRRISIVVLSQQSEKAEFDRQKTDAKQSLREEVKKEETHK